MTKLVKLVKGDDAIVDANIFQLEEIGVPSNYVDKIIQVESIIFSKQEGEDVCITNCGWVIPIKFLKSL